jgi:hypothetical protein
MKQVKQVQVKQVKQHQSTQLCDVKGIAQSAQGRSPTRVPCQPEASKLSARSESPGIPAN